MRFFTSKHLNWFPKIFFVWGSLCLFFVITLIFSGCTVGPNYNRPKVNSPDVFRNEYNVSTNSFADLPWWQIFRDKDLQYLIRVALSNNYDLRIAFAREEQAREVAIETRGQFFPQVGYQGSAARARNVQNNLPAPTGITANEFELGASVSWEIDLWGQIRRLNESARAQYLATHEARRDVTISLISLVAQEYFQLQALDQQLQIARDATNSYRESLELFNNRLNGGIASKLETSSARALMDSAAATIPDLERQIALQEDQLSVLIGQNPGPIERDMFSQEKQMTLQIPAGLPSSLLERRPDIREAEQQLRSANAQVGAAISEFFPQLDLTGLLGRASPTLSAFTGGAGNAWGVAGELAGPIFQGGKLAAQYREARAVREQFALQYQAAVLNAFQEVTDALISHERYGAQKAELANAVAAYRVALKIAMERYRLGNASYYEVLQEQQQLFPAENSLVQSKLNQTLSVVQLYAALGGGWNTNTPIRYMTAR